MKQKTIFASMTVAAWVMILAGFIWIVVLTLSTRSRLPEHRPQLENVCRMQYIPEEFRGTNTVPADTARTVYMRETREIFDSVGRLFDRRLRSHHRHQLKNLWAGLLMLCGTALLHVAHVLKTKDANIPLHGTRGDARP